MRGAGAKIDSGPPIIATDEQPPAKEHRAPSGRSSGLCLSGYRRVAPRCCGDGLRQNGNPEDVGTATKLPAHDPDLLDSADLRTAKPVTPSELRRYPVRFHSVNFQRSLR